MGWPKCNTTLENEVIQERPIWHEYTFHELGLGLSAIFGAIAVVLSLLLIILHATHYVRPHEQKHIIRILFMVPIYATVSFLSYKYYTHSIYFEVLRDCYEAFAIASFFTLLCAYIEKDLHAQKIYFRSIKPKNWVLPINWLQNCTGGEHGLFRIPGSGLTWFNVIWVCVFQYCAIRVFMTCVAVGTQVVDLYCLSSLSPAFAHVWVMVIEALAVSIAMYCLIQFYYQIKHDIQRHSPLQKIIAIKLVIFLSFWQSLIISFLTSAHINAIKPTETFGRPDITIGIPAMLLCIEMALFAVFHFFAFSWRPYVTGSKEKFQGGPLGIKALAQAFNPWDIIKAIGRSARWLCVGRKRRHDDPSYQSTQLRLNPKHGESDHEQSAMHESAYYGSSSMAPQTEDDRQNLLGASQPVPVGPARFDQADRSPSPYRAAGKDNYVDANDIGIARSTQHAVPYYDATASRPADEQHSSVRQSAPASDHSFMQQPWQSTAYQYSADAVPPPYRDHGQVSDFSREK